MPLILLSLLLAFVLNAVALPEVARVWRPEFVLMFSLYWVIHTTHRFGMGWAWAAGLLMDVLTQTPLGLHAFAYLVPAAIAWRGAVQLRMVGLAQELLVVAGLLALSALLRQVLCAVTGTPLGAAAWAGLPLGILLWPLVALALGRLHAAFELSR